jgi:hypothetical protein
MTHDQYSMTDIYYLINFNTYVYTLPITYERDLFVLMISYKHKFEG